MQVSIIIATHNEGDALAKTVESCADASADLDHEIVVADDASTDGSVDKVSRRFSQLRLFRHDQRRGASPTKALGARNARGDVLVFLDGHTKPEHGSIARLVQDVELLAGGAIVTPTIPALDIEKWKTDLAQAGHGYAVDLRTLDCRWLTLDEMQPADHNGRAFYESPALIGCAFAVPRELYDKLCGFDVGMRYWGAEDLDFGLKCWLMGYRILHDPEAIVGHSFRETFANYSVPAPHFLVNQLRMARKGFTHGVWAVWLEDCRQRSSEQLADHPEGLWADAWDIFESGQSSVEQERSYLHARRTRDEFWYAKKFHLAWPLLQSAGAAAFPQPAGAAVLPQPAGTTLPSDGLAFTRSSVGPSPRPSPAPGAKLVLQDPQAGKTFAINDAAQAPRIVAQALITGVVPDPTAHTTFTWTIQITFDASVCSHGPARHINPPTVTQTTVGGHLDMALPLVRGGNLLITVRATVAGRTLSTQSQNLQIVGTNPAFATLEPTLPHDTLRRIARLESGCRQFNAAAAGGTSRCPLWSGDNAGGVGIFQLTSPRPTDDQVWSWRANVAGGSALFNQKVSAARQYPGQVRASANFARLVTAFNAHRAASGLPAIQVTLPDFTSSGFNVPNAQLGQLELDAIRGFNGYGTGHDAFGFPLHEFRVSLDPQGFLVVNIQSGTNQGTAVWERVPVASRPHGPKDGDPNYVNHVLAQQPC
jgi:glycosyltransferase involved in cell wall biosynthesis